MNKILVVGSSNTDMVIRTKNFPQPGETLLGGVFMMNPGGKGANQAVAAARLGGQTLFVCKTGNDIFGSQTRENLKKEGIDTSYLLTDPEAPSGVALITVNAEGENTIVVAQGSNNHLTPDDLRQIPELEQAEIIVVQLEIPMETVEFLVSEAKKKNLKMILNPAPAQKLTDTLLDGLFLITPNESEAALLTGVQVKDQASASEAASVLQKKGVHNVVITLGKKGAYLKAGSRPGLIIAAPAVKALDSTAAGDTFNGALAVALSEDMEWERAVGFACRAASLSVTRAGAQASIPYRGEIDAQT